MRAFRQLREEQNLSRGGEEQLKGLGESSPGRDPDSGRPGHGSGGIMPPTEMFSDGKKVKSCGETLIRGYLPVLADALLLAAERSA